MIGSSAAGRPTVVTPATPLATGGMTVSSAMDSTTTTYSYGTQLKHNIKQPNVHTNGTVTYSAVQSSVSEPTSHITTMEHPLWRRAMNNEV